jgi:hypothetical protein
MSSDLDKLCANPGSNQALISACGCLDASKTFKSGVDTYNLIAKQNASVTTGHNIDLQNWQPKHDKWDQDKSKNTKQLQDERKWSNCNTLGQRGTDVCRSGFDNGWDFTGSQDCSDCFWCLTKKYQCQRTSDKILQDTNTWVRTNPEPMKPAEPQQTNNNFPVANIQCCSQMFTGITGDSVNIFGTQQNCTQKITNQITQALTPTPGTSPSTLPTTPTSGTSPSTLPTTPTPATSPTPPTDPPPDTSNTTPLIIGVSVSCRVLVAVGIGSLLLVFLLMYVNSKKSE